MLGAFVGVAFGLGTLLLVGCSTETKQQLAAQLGPYVLPLGVSAFAWVSAWAARWFASHTKNSNLQAGIFRLNDAVNVAVRAVEQTTVTALKAKTVDGKLAPSDAIAVRETALQSIREHFSPGELANLAKSFGTDNLLDVLRTRIDAAVFELRTPSVVPTVVAAPAAVPVVLAAPVAPPAAPAAAPAPAGQDAIAALLKAAGRA